MLIKSADDRQPDITALEALLGRPGLDRQIATRIEREIRVIRAGVAGERDAAYEIEFLCVESRNRMTIHDLRLEVGGRVAQIDHLIINRLLDIWVCESKHFAEGVAINEHGEWVAFYGHRPQGIASPVEQNRRHIAVLADVFAKGLVPLPRRFGIPIKPAYNSLVLVSNEARISRPKGRAAARVDGLDSVIKVDQLAATVERAYDQRALTALGKVVGQQTLEAFARGLAALHSPVQVDWAKRFGLPVEPTRGDAGAPSDALVTAARPSGKPPMARAAVGRPVCAGCGRAVSAAVVAYCQDHVERFGGAIYCMGCQKRVGGTVA